MTAGECDSLVDVLPHPEDDFSATHPWQSLEDRFAWLSHSQYGFDIATLDAFLASGDLLDQDRAHALADRQRAFEIYKAGNLAHAMEIVRYLMLIRRAAEKLMPAVKAERRRSVAQAGQRARGAAACRKYSDEDIALWKRLAADPSLQSLSDRRRGELIAARLGLPKAAAETIRKAI
ncbi:hypothetical protein ACSFA2_16715 [Variovorax sp. LT2P21]|uniref:hypothetical protein n=1 Tax=Variovorax sp. LT2P21 TaxID=3443731 RepID=UPI003F456165